LCDCNAQSLVYTSTYNTVFHGKPIHGKDESEPYARIQDHVVGSYILLLPLRCPQRACLVALVGVPIPATPCAACEHTFPSVAQILPGFWPSFLLRCTHSVQDPYSATKTLAEQAVLKASDGESLRCVALRTAGTLQLPPPSCTRSRSLLSSASRLALIPRLD
jgi:hypothetical protein